MVTFCSLVDPATRAQAEVMVESVRRHHPGARVLVWPPDGLLVEGAERISLPDERSIPALLAHGLAQDELVIYLAPQMCLYGTLEPLFEVARRVGVAVVPRVGSLPDDAEQPDYTALLEAGDVSPAMIAASQGTSAQAFLEWWSRRRAESEASDGRQLSLALEQLPFVTAVPDPGFNVSYWNLHERPLRRAGNEVTAGGSALRAMHFDGFRPDRPYWLSEHGSRVRVIEDPVLSELCGEYAEQVLAAGWKPPLRQLTGMQSLGNGQRIDHLVATLWADAIEDGLDFGDPLNKTAADAFVDWMRGPAPHGAREGVSRYLYAAYLTRPDLQQAFPNLDGGDGVRLVTWAFEHGRREVLTELVTAAGDRASDGTGVSPAVNVIGYLGETLGLAEAARLYIAALQAAEVPVSTIAVTPDLPVEESEKTITRYGSRGYTDLRSGVEPTFNLACLNGDHLAELVRLRGIDVLQGLPTIGQWGWETDVLPPSWSPAFDLVEEVWVYSRFMAENLGRLLPVPVVVVPPAIVAPDPAGAELPVAFDDRFTFVFMLDFFSTLPRKNPLGLVDAFTRAFAPGEGPRLLLKTINARFRPQAADELHHRAAARRDIDFFDEYLEPAQKALLLQRADCYVSLHRSEGFGLPLAEAMALGTPVIATGYSGNTDFTTPHNSYLVDWKLSQVGLDVEIYPPEGTWAEPDIDHAAALMRHVWEHPDEARARGERARTDIADRYAPAVTGAIARARLQRLHDLRQDGSAPTRTHGLGTPGASATLQRVEAALTKFDLHKGLAPAPGGAAGLMRRTVLRLMLPFTFHEREVDQSLVHAVRELGSELGIERARGVRDRARIREIEARLEGLQAAHPSEAPDGAA